MTRRLLLVLAALVFPCFWGTAGLFAQEYRATLVGRVTDPSDAVIPGASIVATNLDTAVASRTVTNETGSYVLPNLPPGRYRVEVEHTGFKKYIRERITLQISDRPTLDVVLEPGEATTSVTVSAEASQLETATASRGEVITGRTLVDLPLNGRNAFALAALAPGVTFTVRGQASTFLRPTANSGISGASISGGRPRFNEALLDGVPNTGSDGLIQFVPSVDAAQEFKVQTNNFDAEYGRFTGGVINATIRSGTNRVHGALFEFIRNSALNARDPFAQQNPQFGYNQFGGSIGGPVWIPELYNGRNRTFFFANYEGSREGVPRAFVASVPTDPQRQGDFSQTALRVAGRATPVTLYDPNTLRQEGAAFRRDPFPGNRIPANRFDPVARNLMQLYPLPNAPGDSVTAANNYLRSFKDPVFDDGYVVRVDHRVSDRHQIFGRFSWRHFHVTRQGAFKNEVSGDFEDRYAPGFALDDTFTLNPSTVLNFRYGYSRFLSEQAAKNLGFDMSRLGFPSSFTGAVTVQAIPQIVISDFTSLSNTGKLSRNAEDTHSLRGNVMKVAGRHSLRTGADVWLMRSYSGSRGANGAGTFSFNNVFTRGPNPQVASVTDGYGLASFLLGLAASGSAANNVATAEQAPYYAFYLQDDFRVNSRLTLNFGIRYEWEGGYTERFNRFNRGFDFNTESPIAAQARANYARSPIPEVPVSQFNPRGGLLFVGVGGLPRGLTNIDRNNISPRIGVAYSLTPRAVLRGGYGVFFGATTLLSDTSHGFSVTTPFVGTIDGGLTPVNTLSNPFPTGILQPPGAELGLLTLVGQGANFVWLDRQQPHAHQYQFSIQRELPFSVLLDAAYSGSQGGSMPVSRQLSFVPENVRAEAERTFRQTRRNILNDSVPNPFFGLIESGALSGRTTTRGQLVRAYPHFTSLTQLNSSIGSSRYDSFQFKATKRLSHGLSFLAAYTSSKLLISERYLNEQDTGLVKELDSNDIPQRLVLSSTWELPIGRGKQLAASHRGVPGRLLEGYQLNVIYTAQGGVPLSVSGAESLGRSASLEKDERSVDRWFDVTVFRQRETLEQTGLDRLPDVRSAGKNNFDISLFKTTAITERVSLQFRAESFKALNRPEYSSPNTSFGSANFGRITRANTFSRQFQFGLKLLW